MNGVTNALTDTPLLLALTDAAVKSAALLMLTAAGSWLLRKKSASARHALWVGALAGVLVLPGLSLMLPTWRVPWLPEWQSGEGKRTPLIAQRVTLSAEGSPTPEAQNGHATLEPVSQINAHKLVVKRPASLDDWYSALNIERSTISAELPSLLFWIWLTGALLALLPMLAGCVQAAWLTRRGRRLDDAGWKSLFEAVARELGLRRAVRLITVPGAVMPFTWGAGRPVVIFPENVETWTVGRRRLVLLHELGHVKRLDWLTQLLGSLACALYWFNPLAWLAARQLRLERELACDDLVLRSGSAPRDYARELLDIAASSARHRLLNWVGVPVARHSKLETRLRAILDGTRERRALTRAAVLGLMGMGLAIVVPMAMLRGAAPTTSSTPAAGTPKPVDSGTLPATTTAPTAPHPSPERTARTATIEQIAEQWASALPASVSPAAIPSSSTSPTADAADSLVAKKLETIFIPLINIDRPTPLDEVAATLATLSRKFDAGGLGLNVHVFPPADGAPLPKVKLVDLTNLNLANLLHIACQDAGYSYTIEYGVVCLRPAAATPRETSGLPDSTAPSNAEAVGQQPQNRVTVKIDEQGRYVFEDKLVTSEELLAQLKTLAAQPNPPTVALQTNPAVTIEQMADLLGLMRHTGLTQIILYPPAPTAPPATSTPAAATDPRVLDRLFSGRPFASTDQRVISRFLGLPPASSAPAAAMDSTTASEAMETRLFPLSESNRLRLLGLGMKVNMEGIIMPAPDHMAEALTEALVRAGLNFPTGSKLDYTEDTLIVRNTPVNLDALNKFLMHLTGGLIWAKGGGSEKNPSPKLNFGISNQGVTLPQSDGNAAILRGAGVNPSLAAAATNVTKNALGALPDPILISAGGGYSPALPGADPVTFTFQFLHAKVGEALSASAMNAKFGEGHPITMSKMDISANTISVTTDRNNVVNIILALSGLDREASTKPGDESTTNVSLGPDRVIMAIEIIGESDSALHFPDNSVQFTPIANDPSRPNHFSGRFQIPPPKKIILQSGHPLTVSQAVTQEYSMDNSARVVTLRRMEKDPDGQVRQHNYIVDMEAILSKGEKDKDMELRPGDVIQVEANVR